MLHRGFGANVVERFVDDVVFAQPSVRACVASPVEGNMASIRTFEKAGFARWKTVRPEAGELECVLRKDRAGDIPPA